MFHYVLFILVLQSVCSLPLNDDNKLLSLILKEDYTDNEYTVVDPKTTISIMNENLISFDPLVLNGYDAQPLIRQLIEKNRESISLTVESNPSKGYIIDKEKKFLKYFTENGGGWNKLYEENPKVHGLTSVSLPVYDKQANLVLVYKSFSQNFLAGEGNLIIYSFDDSNGELKELSRRMIWVS
ncbi:unnamed protein product [Adineta steineri]|uniref:Uncharacterized protein n=1 Tax=Adineta steineri TaxID=433720 RepID=A0A818QDJ7_9BILA|nr:unnamed protein product [Adineta steineri]CAF0919668.1 unnamed protein product [Adineta steineri]CAF3637523.1 unnamed protein product [Adineta steineri]CAF4194885.1 unnamed protein product [Adineta steineri]